ncbi:hypothetical protein K2P47_00180 [Patescibacteria group bacterium]|nr:hypothetical protein [Patescibacteria group bacterium]
MAGFVTFESLKEGDLFFARGKFHCKSEIGVFQKPNDGTNVTYNAFYFDGPTGKWAHFDAPTLVQIYDESVHGQPADIINLHNVTV